MLRVLASPWFAVFVLVAILAYATVFSAFPQVRGAMEVSEQQAFRHPLFVALVILFMVGLTTATLFRTRWNRVNLGALTTHAGLLLLCAGGLYYFGTKIEGHVLLRSPRVIVSVFDGADIEPLHELLAEPGERWNRRIPGFGPQPVRVTITDVTAGELQPVVAATVTVEIGSETQTVALAANGPPVSIGPNFQLALQTFPTEARFFETEAPALYVREPGTDGRSFYPLRGLPLHRERMAAPLEPLHDANATRQHPRGQVVPLKRSKPVLKLGGLEIPTGWFEPWRMPLVVDRPELPFVLRISGYVPYIRGLRQQDENGQRQTVNGQPRYVPVLEPLSQRRPSIAAYGASAIRIEAVDRESGQTTYRNWLAFSPYPHHEDAYRLRIPSAAGDWEVTYSRRPHDLETRLAAERLRVEYFPGRRGIERYQSELRAQRPGGEPFDVSVSTNNTHAIGRWTLYQSGAAQDGWSFTVLGVGNRNGILAMNIGWIVVTLGSMYAFYVKPVLLRRMKAAGRNAAGGA